MTASMPDSKSRPIGAVRRVVARLLRLRRLMHRVLFACFALMIVLLLVRFLGPTPSPVRLWAATYFLPVVSTFGILYVWLEAAIVGVDPESRFYVPDAPPFRATLFAAVGLMALWQSLGNAGYLLGLEGNGWTARRLGIFYAGAALAGVIVLVEAWWERHSTYPLACWRQLVAALGGVLALLVALPWESPSPIVAERLKPWLYGALSVSIFVGCFMGFPHKYDVERAER